MLQSALHPLLPLPLLTDRPRGFPPLQGLGCIQPVVRGSSTSGFLLWLSLPRSQALHSHQAGHWGPTAPGYDCPKPPWPLPVPTAPLDQSLEIRKALQLPLHQAEREHFLGQPPNFFQDPAVLRQ